MIDPRRAYRGWFLRRMSWLLPSLGAALTVFVSLATNRAMEWWLRLPALALAGSILLLFSGLTIVPLLVLYSLRRGDRYRAQSLRREFYSYPAVALISLSLALGLLSVPLLFAPRLEPMKPPTRILAGSRSNRAAAPAIQDAKLPVAPSDPTPVAAPLALESKVLAPDPAPPSSPVQEPAPERSPIPAATAVPVITPVLPSGEEFFTFRFRPGVDAPDLDVSVLHLRPGLNRSGLPFGEDPEDWLKPELQIDLTLVPETNGWVGAIYGLTIDVPIEINTSLRSSYFIASLDDSPQEGEIDLEATVVWHRATIEIEQRLAGYTRTASLDVAIRAGLSVDRLDTQDANISVKSTARLSPWLGIEVGVWQQDQFGIVVQASHSFAMHISEAAASVTDLRIELKLDLSEPVSLRLGWRYLALRIHDRDDGFERLERTCSGPVAGVDIRF